MASEGITNTIAAVHRFKRRPSMLKHRRTPDHSHLNTEATMATQKSIAKGVRANSSTKSTTAAVSRRRTRRSPSSPKPSTRRTSVPSSSSEEEQASERDDLIEHLSAQLALVETASIALQKFEEQQEIGA